MTRPGIQSIMPAHHRLDRSGTTSLPSTKHCSLVLPTGHESASPTAGAPDHSARGMSTGIARRTSEVRTCMLRGLTFELRRDRRYCAWPARRIMNQGALRAKCNAVGPRLQRGVRQRRPDARGE
jgi:hypothetical protein